MSTMGRNSESPRRKSHSRRERSPRSSNMEKLSSQNRSRSRSPKLVKLRSSPPLSLIKEKLTRSPKRVSPSPEKEKRTRSPKSARSRSPESHSLSPRSKRLKRVKAERDALKGSEREHDKTNGRKGEHKEKDSESELPVGNGSSRPRHRRSPSPSHHHHRGRRRSRSPPSAADKRGRHEHRSSREAEQRNDDNDSIAKMKAAEETLEAKDKQKPSFELSGKLAAETNRFRGVTLLFNEPPDARKPDTRWRLYVFKGGEVLNEPLRVHRQTCYLFGRERRVADIPTDHPSCSKQHAVLQYRQVEEENPDGSMSKRVRPYLMDLGSTNGTFINDNQMEPQRYYELFEKDTIKFGNSSREYVILHENSAG